MDFDDYFKEELIFFLDTDSKDQVFKKMAKRLYEKGYVKDTYLEAITERERNYPTGLRANEGGVAIPHTDHFHVQIPVIGVAILKDPIPFIHMGTDHTEVNVNIVFMLAIKEPDTQLAVLQMVTAIIQDQEVLKTLKSSSSTESVINIIRRFSKIYIDN